MWRAGWLARVAAAKSCLWFPAFVERPARGMMAAPRPGAVLFAAWPSLVAGWLCCRVGLWRLIADRDGVHLRRMWTVTFLPLSKIGRVELRRDGLLEFLGATQTPLAALFPPAWADRLMGWSRSRRPSRTGADGDGPKRRSPSAGPGGADHCQRGVRFSGAAPGGLLARRSGVYPPLTRLLLSCGLVRELGIPDRLHHAVVAPFAVAQCRGRTPP
ncbi:hypothetical protein SAM23877_0241 [Streptomyces ambofaciens ATCC 23877]|uniref:Uncharacterized protein n=1 Tax=Streptomyces ambofaciens (strain ATCC 23877 / 3486 / DSM 40053 / JCM 4204 / NBRC 12836 / NRRL B-2516) TaxID=278992 RepID=A0A0K2AJN1_STRA7|nr:hypothetical protein SAM23877_0241 [Streptomyces ambofaciens ATCC 23877]